MAVALSLRGIVRTAFFRSSSSIFALIVVLFAVAACSGSRTHTVTVRVVSDYAAGHEVVMARTELVAGDAIAHEELIEFAVRVDAPLSRGMTVATFEGVPRGTHTILASLLRSLSSDL